MTPGRSEGVKPGTYRVYFAPTISEAEEAVKQGRTEADFAASARPPIDIVPTRDDSPIPIKFQSLHTSDLSLTIDAGKNDIDLSLTGET